MNDTSPISRSSLDEFFERCRQEFNVDSKGYCIKMLLNVSEAERNGIFSCNVSEHHVRLEHFYNTYYAECAAIDISILRWVLPPLMLLCTGGNVLALLIYRMSYFDGSSSVHFLRAKALANIIFVNSRLLEVIHAWTDPASETFEATYWYTRPYIMSVSNISGTMSTWLTLLVTIETVMCIIMPFTFRHYCTVRMTWTLLAITLFFSSCLNLSLVPTTTISTGGTILFTQSDDGGICWYERIFYFAENAPQWAIVQAAVYWTTMFAVIMMPTLAMLICTVIIVRQFSLKAMGETFSQRRKCVIRMTVSTTLSHLLLEGPSVMTFTAAAIWGKEVGENFAICVLNHALNLASVVNATIPFFVFLLCSEQFRHMATVFIKAHMEHDKERRSHILSQAGVRYSARPTIRTERTTIESKFISAAHL